MTAVVADSSPLHYLIIIGHEGVLSHLFDTIVVPPKVIEELSRPSTPSAVRDWIHTPPDWLRIDPRPLSGRILHLGPGEADAIALAIQLGVTVLLIDEHRGRVEALRHGLRPLGVVGILESAAAHGLLDLPDAVQKLVSSTNFRISQRVVDEILKAPRK